MLNVSSSAASPFSIVSRSCTMMYRSNLATFISKSFQAVAGTWIVIFSGITLTEFAPLLNPPLLYQIPTDMIARFRPIR